MMTSGAKWTVLAVFSPSMLLAQWRCLWLVYCDGLHLATRSGGAELSVGQPHYESEPQCTDPIVQYGFTVRELRAVASGTPMGKQAGVAERVLLVGQKVFNCIVERAQKIRTFADDQNDERAESSASTTSTDDEFRAFSIKRLFLPGLEEVYQLQFYCKKRQGGTVTVVACAPHPDTLPGLLKLEMDFEVLPRKVAKKRFAWCRISHNAVSLRISSLLEAAAGLCTAFGYRAQLMCNEQYALLEWIPWLQHVGPGSVGFKPQPARYVPSRHPFSLAGVKPTSDKPSERRTDRSAAYFEPRHLEGFDSWFGVGVDHNFFEEAVQNAVKAVHAAVMTDGQSNVGDDCVVRIAVPHGHEDFFRNIGDDACKRNSPFLTCVQAVAAAGDTYALCMLLSEIKNLFPDVHPSSARMVRILSEPRAWRSLHALIGPGTARFFDSETRADGKEATVAEASSLSSYEDDTDLRESPVMAASELFRFAIWYIDIFPSRRYWDSLNLGCVRRDLAYVNTMGRLQMRQPSELPALMTKKEEERMAPSSMLYISGVTDEYEEPPKSAETGARLNEDGGRTLTERAAVVLPYGQEVRPLQQEYYFGELRAVSDLNPPVRDTDAEVRQRWLASPLFNQQGYLLIKDVPARDGGAFDLKVFCTRTGRFYRTRLSGWFSDYLCEPDYVEVPNSDVAGVWRKDDMPVNRMLGIEFESRPPWRCGVSFLGDEHNLKETPVKGSHLLTIMTGLCSLMGFKTGWVLDSARDLFTRELMKVTMVLEKRVGFYEAHGFLLSVDTLKSRRRAETCVGASLADIGAPLVGVCHQPRDILINPGFERIALLTLAKKAYDTFYTLTFDCTSPLWRNCAKLYPLSVKDPRGTGCAFERHPLYQELKHLKPDKCNFGKRIGDCHRYVRKQLKCDRHHKRGCKYLAFLYSAFLYPGDDIEQEMPPLLRDQFEAVSVDLFHEGKRHMLEGLNKAAGERKVDLEACRLGSCAEGGSPDYETGKDVSGSLLQSLTQDERDIKEMQNTLLESVIFHDWTNTPQFWIRAIYERHTDKSGEHVITKLYCPVGYAWAYITRIQGQLYRHPSQAAY